MFQKGLGVPTDYAKAMAWFDNAAAQGNSAAENQLGWMYQFGQGVQPDDAKAVSWYRMSADLGNRRGADNLDAFKNVLEIRGSGDWDAANTPVTDAAIARAQRWANIQDLQSRIGGRCTKAGRSCQPTRTHRQRQERCDHQDFQCHGQRPRRQVPCRAAKYRAEAARLHEELAKIENQDKFSAGIPAP